MKQATMTVLVMIVAAIIAFGYGKFVYPVNPLIVWCLLFVCWLCYRLHRRALETFGPRSARRRRSIWPEDQSDLENPTTDQP